MILLPLPVLRPALPMAVVERGLRGLPEAKEIEMSKMTQKQIDKAMADAAEEYEAIASAVWEVLTRKLSKKTGLDISEVEEIFGAIT